MGKNIIITIILLIYLCLPVIGQTVDPGIPADQRTDWAVYFMPHPLNSEQRFSLPVHSMLQVMWKQFRNAPERRISFTERSQIAAELLHKRRLELLEELNTAVKARDAILFTWEDNRFRQFTELQTKEKTITEIHEKLALLDSMKIDDIEVNEELQIRMRELDSIDSERTMAVKEHYHLGDFAKEESIDQVIYSSIEAVSDSSVYLIVSEYNAVLDQHALVSEIIVTLGDVEETIRRIKPGLVQAILGYRTASLLIAVKNEEGLVDPRTPIYLDGEFNGHGMVERLFLEPGERTVMIRNIDNSAQTKNVHLIAGESRELYFYMDGADAQDITITSDPTGVQVYQDSLFIGTTPLTVQRPIDVQALYLSRPNYYTSWLFVRPDSPDELAIRLFESSVNRSNELKKKRDLFYQSLGYMAFSVPFPMIFSTLYQGLAVYLNSSELSSSAAQENKLQHDIYQGVFWGTLGITLGLTGYMLYRLIDYIQYSGTYSEETKGGKK